MAVPQSVTQPRILVVAGDRTSIRRLGSTLQESGYADVVSTTSASRAVRLCQQTRPNVVILESCLDGFSGYDVAEQLYDGLDPDEVPHVLMVTAGCDEVSRLQAQMLHAAGVPVRSCGREELTREVEAALICGAKR